MRKLTGIVIGMIVLATSCQMPSQEIENEVVIEQPRPTNVDSKGNMEYAKAMMSLHKYDGEYLYQALFYETTDTYNEWRDSLQTRYKTNKRLTGVRLPDAYSAFDGIYFAYNKVTVLISTADKKPYGVAEYYLGDASLNYWCMAYDSTAHVYIKDDVPWALYWSRNN